MLHNEKDAFEQLVLRTSDYLGVKAEIVEKDYFVTIFLKRIAAVMPDIVFKGGTSNRLKARESSSKRISRKLSVI